MYKRVFTIIEAGSLHFSFDVVQIVPAEVKRAERRKLSRITRWGRP